MDWDFLFLESESGHELKSFSISSKSKIRSGEVKFLTKQVLPAFLGDKTKPAYARGKPAVVIRRIHFADGWQWQGSLRKPLASIRSESSLHSLSAGTLERLDAKSRRDSRGGANRKTR